MLHRYLKWTAINSFTTSVCSVISTNTMLSTITNTPSIPSVITLNYVGKDIIGQFGGLLYAWKTGKNADRDSLNYITKGALTLQASFYIENSLPLVSNNLFILPILGVSSALKNISFISIGAVNAKNLQKLSNNNIGECYSKSASINTIASTLGMICGVSIIHFIPSYSILILPVMSTISIYSVRKSTKIAEELDHTETR